MRQCSAQTFLLLGIWVACVGAHLESGQAGSYDIDAAVSLADVTPQIPDGPVVQAYQRLIEKKKLAAEVERQKTLVGPLLKRGDAKQKAKRHEMEMFAEVEIKNRMSKKELRLKRKDQLDEQADRARFQAAHARRLERYEKWSQSEVIRNNERLKKLHAHTSSAFKMAKKLFKRKRSTKKSAIESLAKAKAASKQELTVGGYLDLKGDQINFPELVGLNDDIAKAMGNPIDMNIAFAQKAYDTAAQAVAKEQEGFDRKAEMWKEQDEKVKDEREVKQADRHNKKLDELALKVSQEAHSKKSRQNRIEQENVANEINEKDKWKKAFADIKAERQQVTVAERKEKSDLNNKIENNGKEKKMKAPALAVEAKKKVYTERSEKYGSARSGGPDQAYIAKNLKVRACEELADAELQLAKFKLPERLGESSMEDESLRKPPDAEKAEKASANCKK